jgi:hypothetical protein
MTVFPEIEGLQVAIFSDEEAALRWLRGQP